MNEETIEELEANEADKMMNVGETDETTDKLLLSSIKREYFSPSELNKAQERLSEVMVVAEDNATAPIRNFDPEKDFPNGYGLYIHPITQRGTDGNETIGIAVAALPDPETIANAEGGSDYIRKVILDAEIAKLANSVRPRSDNSVAASIPFSIQDFITSSRGGESMATFRKLASIYVAALKKKGIRHMTNVLLRQIFQSSAFAESQFPKIPQESWVKVINSMIGKADAEKLETSVLVNWRETRDQAEMAVDEIDLEGFGELV